MTVYHEFDAERRGDRSEQLPLPMQLHRALASTFERNIELVQNGPLGEAGVAEINLGPIGEEMRGMPLLPNLIPLHVDAVEAFVPGRISEQGGIFKLSGELKSDGSPYVFDEDLDRAAVYHDMHYSIVSSPEHPPFLTHDNNLIDQPHYTHGIRGMLEGLRADGLPTHQLDDIACRELIKGSQAFEVDINELRVEIEDGRDI